MSPPPIFIKLISWIFCLNICWSFLCLHFVREEGLESAKLVFFFIRSSLPQRSQEANSDLVRHLSTSLRRPGAPWHSAAFSGAFEPFRWFLHTSHCRNVSRNVWNASFDGIQCTYSWWAHLLGLRSSSYLIRSETPVFASDCVISGWAEWSGVVLSRMALLVKKRVLFLTPIVWGFFYYYFPGNTTMLKHCPFRQGVVFFFLLFNKRTAMNIHGH